LRKLRIKALYIFVALVVLLSFTTIRMGLYGIEKGNNKETAQEKNATLTIWSHFFDPQSSDGNTRAFYSSLEAIKSELPYIKLKHTGIPGELYKMKIKTARAANELPDIFFTWGGGFAAPFITSEKTLALDDYLNDGTLEKIIPGTIENFKFNGKIYGLPYNIAIASLYCNTELFDNNSVKVPETWEELLSAVKKFRSKGITPITIGAKDRWPAMQWNAILAIRTGGAEASNDVLRKVKPFDIPEFIDAARKMKELIELGAFEKDALKVSYYDAKNMFLAGAIPMFYMGSWINGEIEDCNSKVKGKIIPVKFPIINGGRGNSNEFYGGSGETFMISKDTNSKETAVKTVKFICENISKNQYRAGSGLPAWISKYEDNSEINRLSLMLNDLTSNANGFVYWWDTVLPSKEADIQLNLWVEFIDGKLTPEQYCESLCNEIKLMR
jgi:raffinose/stachyose/melibiose transport system substrate-binding protein